MYDNRGGAAIASYRLHRGLIEQGHFSRMLVLNNNINDDTILNPIGKSRKLMNLFSQRFDNYLLKFQKSPNPNYQCHSQCMSNCLSLCSYCDPGCGCPNTNLIGWYCYIESEIIEEFEECFHYEMNNIVCQMVVCCDRCPDDFFEECHMQCEDDVFGGGGN